MKRETIEWIAVRDRMPEIGSRVLVMQMRNYQVILDIRDSLDQRNLLTSCTHWAHLPRHPHDCTKYPLEVTYQPRTCDSDALKTPE
jgi:hypothetical protein